jgi:phenylacetic acid degradation operon negative regulatory protein
MKQDTKEVILEIAKGAGIISLALLLPGACDAIRHFKKLEKLDRRRKYYINSTIKNLIAEGLLISDKEGRVRLSESGERYLGEIEQNSEIISKPQKWDGKYRVIVFDIPEEKKRIRNVIRRQLINWGFAKLQHSVWVHPYECQNIITLLKTRFFVTGEVLYLTVESIENDSWIRKKFSL